MIFEEFANKLITKINNDSREVWFSYGEDCSVVSFYVNGTYYGFDLVYRDSKLLIIVFNEELYTFDIDRLQYKRFILNIAEAAKNHNRKCIEKFLDK